VQTTKPSTAGTRIISVGGGKGGVGKSLVSTNLAVTIANAGHEVVLCDLDLGAANLHLMLGLTHPRPGITTLLSGEGELEDALTPTSIPRLRLLAGTGGTVAAANINHAQKLRIIRKLRALTADYVVVDVGAGVGYNALDFFELGQQRIIVATPQVTSMHDAYAFLKGAVLRTLRHHSARSPQADLLEPALASKEGEKVKDLLLRIREHDDAFGDKVVQILKRFGAYLIGNQVADPSQVGVLNAVSKMVEDYLGIALPILGWIPQAPRLAESVNERKPLMARLTQGEPREMRAFRSIVETLLVGDVAPEEELLIELVDEGVAAPPPPPLDP
jgi:flagellar biosynthesis protein FlhG